MHARVFSAQSAGQLQQDLTQWLSQNPTITILTAVQSTDREQRPGYSGMFQIILTIFYEEQSPMERT
jgi:hypothetical protein